MKKTPLIAGNWKMNKSSKEAVEFIKKLAPEITDCSVDVYLALPFTFILEANKASEKTKIVIGAQNMNDAQKGAFTGEISGIMLREAGAEFVILGHSERRAIFKEDNDFINKKVIRAVKDDLRPILCIGETEGEREKNETEGVLEEQIKNGLKGISKEDVSGVVIAYEPVWAIGSGKAATPKMVQEVHKFIRKCLERLFNKKISGEMHILYGGSVKPENIESLMQEKDIDGALIGGASLEVESFLKIIKSV
jgi:triosephosphate isomerase